MSRGGRPEPLRPVAAHQLEVARRCRRDATSTARAAASNSPDHLRGEAHARAPPANGASTVPRTPTTAPPSTTSSSTRWRNANCTSPRSAAEDRARTARRPAGPGAPGQVEARNRVPVRERVGRRRARPSRRSAARAARARAGQSRFSIVRRTRRRRGPSAAASSSSGRSNRAEPSQSGQRELERVLDPHPPLLGRVDEEQPAERPERLPAEVVCGSPGRAPAPGGRRRQFSTSRPGRRGRLRQRSPRVAGRKSRGVSAVSQPGGRGRLLTHDPANQDPNRKGSWRSVCVAVQQQCAAAFAELLD